MGNNVINFNDYVFSIAEVPPGSRLREYPGGPVWVVIGPSRILGDRYVHYTKGFVWQLDIVHSHIHIDTRVKRNNMHEYQIVS